MGLTWLDMGVGAVWHWHYSPAQGRAGWGRSREGLGKGRGLWFGWSRTGAVWQSTINLPTPLSPCFPHPAPPPAGGPGPGGPLSVRAQRAASGQDAVRLQRGPAGHSPRQEVGGMSAGWPAVLLACWLACSAADC